MLDSTCEAREHRLGNARDSDDTSDRRDRRLSRPGCCPVAVTGVDPRRPSPERHGRQAGTERCDSTQREHAIGRTERHRARSCSLRPHRIRNDHARRGRSDQLAKRREHGLRAEAPIPPLGRPAVGNDRLNGDSGNDLASPEREHRKPEDEQAVRGHENQRDHRDRRGPGRHEASFSEPVDPPAGRYRDDQGQDPECRCDDAYLCRSGIERQGAIRDHRPHPIHGQGQQETRHEDAREPEVRALDHRSSNHRRLAVARNSRHKGTGNSYAGVSPNPRR
jgi:hypothetical protein